MITPTPAENLRQPMKVHIDGGKWRVLTRAAFLPDGSGLFSAKHEDTGEIKTIAVKRGELIAAE